jgi:hypothetical protein
MIGRWPAAISQRSGSGRSWAKELCTVSGLRNGVGPRDAGDGVGGRDRPVWQGEQGEQQCPERGENDASMLSWRSAPRQASAPVEELPVLSHGATPPMSLLSRAL